MRKKSSRPRGRACSLTCPEFLQPLIPFHKKQRGLVEKAWIQNWAYISAQPLIIFVPPANQCNTLGFAFSVNRDRIHIKNMQHCLGTEQSQEMLTLVLEQVLEAFVNPGICPSVSRFWKIGSILLKSS